MTTLRSSSDFFSSSDNVVFNLLKLKSDVVVFRGAGANQFLSCLIGDNTVDTEKAKTLLENYSNINETIIQKRIPFRPI